MELFSRQSDQHELKIDLPDGELWVVCEQDRIAQVVSNLLSNAIKYSPEGEVVTLRAKGDDGKVEVSVEDSGLGIPLEQQVQVFTKFFRVENEQTQGIDGTGLGLAICKEIVEAHNGESGWSPRALARARVSASRCRPLSACR